MDTSVGRVLDWLDSTGLARDTLVLFASDHGTHVDKGAMGGSNGQFSGGKGVAVSEGGIR